MDQIDANHEGMSLLGFVPTGQEPGRNESPSTVGIVENDETLLRKLCVLLESARLSVETYRTPEEFLRMREMSRPGCLILGVRLPQMGGLALHRRLRGDDDPTPVIFLTPYDDVQTAVEAMREGAFDYLQTPVNEQYLLDRVHAAMQKDRANRQAVAAQREAAARFQELSPKESAVLDLMMKGRPSRDIARELEITGKTVCFHQANIKRKVNANTSAGLAYLYFVGGLHGLWRGSGTRSTDQLAGRMFAEHGRNRLNSWASPAVCHGT